MDEASLVDNPPENNPSLPENGVEDSSKPAAEQPMTDAGDLPSAITDFYRGKSILLTGATGFVGKAVLWKLLETLGDGLGKVYLLVRNGSNKRSKIGRPLDRVKNEILQTKPFLSLRSKMGADAFDALVQEKLISLAGDIISPDLSLSEQDRSTITENVQIVIHCAASLDCHERLDLSLETNTLGTLRLMDLADECKHMMSFVHMSVGYTNEAMPDGFVQERVYPLNLGDPEELLTEIVGLELHDIPRMTKRILESYPNTYAFTKVLTEHLILKRVDYNRVEEAQGGKVQWPISIVRATQVAGAAFEPLQGWVDGITGFNSAVYLFGQGVQTLQPDVGVLPADLIPVDYLARILIGVAAIAKPPGIKFLLPYNEIIDENDTDQRKSVQEAPIPCFPAIYQATADSLRMTTWSEIYDAMRHYWTRATAVDFPTSDDYFVKSQAFLKARMFMKSHITSVSAAVAQKMGSTNDRTVELASNLWQENQGFIRRRFDFGYTSIEHLTDALEVEPRLKLSIFHDLVWYDYMIHYCFGIHSSLLANGKSGLRNMALPSNWDCALFSRQPEVRDSIVERQIESVVFSASDIDKRTKRMLQCFIAALENPHLTSTNNHNEEWISDFDASLDDWCHDDSQILKDGRAAALIGRWGTQIGENDEPMKVTVLNDRRVAASVRQVIEVSGVPKETVVGEALKILQRMRERTQFAYVWFAGSFLDTLFKRLFSSVRLQMENLDQLREKIQGKNVVYVPASKTVLDQLLIWYMCLRYRLPMPAIVCDEALALLGPLSDIMRIAGAFFVRRDHASRSPLSSAVTAAYIEALLREHGALSMLIERTRSRTGRLQPYYADGLVDMVVEASLESHQDQNKKIKDTLIVPVNVSYEKVPGLSVLIDQVLGKSTSTANPKPAETPEVTETRQSALSRSTSLFRSGTRTRRNTNKQEEGVSNGKYGRVYVGFGDVVDIQQLAASDSNDLPNRVLQAVQRSQHDAAIVTPVGIVAAVVLSGRESSGISMGDLYERCRMLAGDITSRGRALDWQDEEDTSTLVAYALDLLEAKKHILIEGRRLNETANVRVLEHADNVMALSYMANQLVEVLLPESIFAIGYLAGTSDEISKDELYNSYTFLMQLFCEEFVYSWNAEEKFVELLEWATKEHIIQAKDSETFYRIAAQDAQSETYNHICVLGSLLYPTLDAYWISSCSLSALRDLPFMPRKAVPVLAQWIAAHLISGRRSIYREVLSTEASQNAVDNFLKRGLIQAVHPKSKLSPDAQIVLLELGVTTNEDLVMVNEHAEVDVEERKEGLKNISSMCHMIERHRFGDGAQQQSDLQVFDKCQNQIRSILRADESYASHRGLKLSREEDQMIQLVYALKNAASGSVASTERGHAARNPRRISEAYNLRKV